MNCERSASPTILLSTHPPSSSLTLVWPVATKERILAKASSGGSTTLRHGCGNVNGLNASPRTLDERSSEDLSSSPSGFIHLEESEGIFASSSHPNGVIEVVGFLTVCGLGFRG